MLGQPLRVIVAAAAAVLLSPSWSTAAQPPFELSVKNDHFWGSSRGTLIVGQDGMEYRTADDDDARSWSYEDIKQLQVLSPTRITILTYEDRGKMRSGADREFRFSVSGTSITPEIVTFFLERTDPPIVTAVMPRIQGNALFRAQVKHQRQGRGSDGALALYDKQLVYQTERTGESRYWRFADIYSVLRLDRFRLEIRAYEGGSGVLRPFVFELKSELPGDFYEALWARVNRTAFDPAIKDF
ncbi:MAG: hypothetical protein K2Y23_06800 [Cyanobacteria bacterium]|nr:hypothetical protein [Cyanobacteriota bacterium]